MGLEKLKYFIKCLFILVLSFSSAQAQQSVLNFDSTITTAFDSDLRPVKLTKKNSNSFVVFVSSTNCSGCVKYFIKRKKKFTFLFLLNSESLLEINKIIKTYNLKNCSVYFTTSPFVYQKKKDLCQSPTPCFFQRCGDKTIFFNYSELDKITEEFTISEKKFNTLFNCSN